MKRVKMVLSAALFVAFFTEGICSVTYADTKYYSIPPVAFHPWYSTQGYINGSFELRPTNVVEGNVFLSPVYLPDSAEITEFKAWVFDTHGSLDIVANMARIRLGEMGPGEIIASVNSSGSSGIQELTDNTINYGVIDNATFRYTASVGLPAVDAAASHRFVSIRIKYEIPQVKIEEFQSAVNPPSELNMKVYPTPVSDKVTINYEVPQKGVVSLKIYDLSGRVVKTLFTGTQTPSEYLVIWNGTDDRGNRVPAGNYFYRLEIDSKTTTEKTIILK
ncbi:MAG: T9SS type A sorting domain-containing protein [bacterium]|nr:T9SS type A sorting domain-containing protein [bacterium]